MLTLALKKPHVWEDGSPCWELNSLTHSCSLDEGCDDVFWQEQTSIDVGCSANYYHDDEDLRLRERYVQIVSRWYAVPGSERYIDHGLARLFAARDSDKCMLIYMDSFTHEDWQNCLIGAALSGNNNTFDAVLSEKFSSVQNLGTNYLYDLYGDLFRARLQRAAAIGGSEHIFRYVKDKSFADNESLVYGGNLTLIREIENITSSMLRTALYSGNKEVVSYLSSKLKLPLQEYAEDVIASGNLELLNFTGRASEREMARGLAARGDLPSLNSYFKSYSQEILEACTESVSPLRYDIAKKAMFSGAKANSSILRNAILTGDAQFVSLLNMPLTSDYIYDVISTGSLEMARMFPQVKGLQYADYAAELGFAGLNLYYNRK